MRTKPTIERLAADLRRIGGIATGIHNDKHVYARAFRLRAVEQAYDDTLLLACEELEVDAEGLRSPLCDLDRLRLEAELSQRGFVW